jgi:hypothetical protein
VRIESLAGYRIGERRSENGSVAVIVDTLRGREMRVSKSPTAHTEEPISLLVSRMIMGGRFSAEVPELALFLRQLLN